MRYELFLALRYLNGLRRSQPFVSVIALISVLGVAVGVAALLVVLGVMSGFDADLEAKIVGSNPHLVVHVEDGLAGGELLRKIESTPGVVVASPFIQTQVLLRIGDQATGVILRGVDPEGELRVTGLADSVKEGRWPPGPGQLIVGSELARRWGLHPGSAIAMIAGEKPKPHPMEVAGIFTTGMYDYDLNLVLASNEAVQQLLGTPDRISGIGVRLEAAMKAPAMKKVLQQRLGYPYWVTTWMDMNQNLFSALKLEKLVMFVILTLIILVACFNIIATLLMMVVGKTKEVGILKSVGATSGSVRRIFTFAGLMIGVMGTFVGVAIGLGLCAALAKYQFIQLPAEVYYIDKLPVKLEWRDVSSVVLAAIGISWLACLYPAWAAARMQPAEALRYE